MRIYDDIRIVGMERTMYVLQRALTFVYEDDLFEPKIDFDFGRFKILYKKNKMNICIEISMIELEYAKLTLEQFALDTKKHVISQYRHEINKMHFESLDEISSRVAENENMRGLDNDNPKLKSDYEIAKNGRFA